MVGLFLCYNTGMYKEVLKFLRIIFGVALVAVGVAGIFLPILPGWILVFVGIELIGIRLVFMEDIREFARQKINQISAKKKR